MAGGLTRKGAFPGPNAKPYKSPPPTHTTKPSKLVEPSRALLLLLLLASRAILLLPPRGLRPREMDRKPGDWSCRSCQYVNFARRDSCQRCGEPKLGVDRPDYTSISGGWDVKPGDWYCSCGVHNYASRSNCFKCGAAKDDSTAEVARSWGFRYDAPAGWKSGDWICTRPGCNGHNYASRTECYSCNAPKDHAY